ncbi:MAG: hypothetical protein ABI882_03185 [Acidobacteriota bacterium]
MNDLLTNLVLRTLKPEEGIQPRLRTRFEPSRLEPTPAPASALVHPEVQRPTTMDLQQAASTTHRNASPTKDETPGRFSPDGQLTESDMPDTLTTDPTIRATKRSLREPEVERTRLMDLARHPPSSATASRRKERDDVLADVTPLQPTNPAQQPVTPRPHSEAHQRRIDVDGHQPTSTVRVTIGRIEVRAVLQSTAVKAGRTDTRTTARPAVMTLDEYLSRRAKGGAS